MTPQQKIVEILESWEDRLSDGYGYYVTPEDVQETLRKIADEIIAVINNQSDAICPVSAMQLGQGSRGCGVPTPLTRRVSTGPGMEQSGSQICRSGV